MQETGSDFGDLDLSVQHNTDLSMHLCKTIPKEKATKALKLDWTISTSFGPEHEVPVAGFHNSQ